MEFQVCKTTFSSLQFAENFFQRSALLYSSENPKQKQLSDGNGRSYEGHTSWNFMPCSPVSRYWHHGATYFFHFRAKLSIDADSALLLNVSNQQGKKHGCCLNINSHRQFCSSAFFFPYKISVCYFPPLNNPSDMYWFLHFNLIVKCVWWTDCVELYRKWPHPTYTPCTAQLEWG